MMTLPNCRKQVDQTSFWHFNCMNTTLEISTLFLIGYLETQLKRKSLLILFLFLWPCSCFAGSWLVVECAEIPGSLCGKISRTESGWFFWDLPSRPPQVSSTCRANDGLLVDLLSRLPPPHRFNTPLVRSLRGAVWPLGIFRLRSACVSSRMFLSPAVDCMSSVSARQQTAQYLAVSSEQWACCYFKKRKTCQWHCAGRSLERQTVCNLWPRFVTHKKSILGRRQTVATHTVN